jgi:hypothetical protein
VRVQYSIDWNTVSGGGQWTVVDGGIHKGQGRLLGNCTYLFKGSVVKGVLEIRLSSGTVVVQTHRETVDVGKAEDQIFRSQSARQCSCSE